MLSEININLSPSYKRSSLEIDKRRKFNYASTEKKRFLKIRAKEKRRRLDNSEEIIV